LGIVGIDKGGGHPKKVKSPALTGTIKISKVVSGLQEVQKIRRTPGTFPRGDKLKRKPLRSRTVEGGKCLGVKKSEKKSKKGSLWKSIVPNSVEGVTTSKRKKNSRKRVREWEFCSGR